MKRIELILEKITKLITYFTSFLMVALTSVVFFNVITRYFFDFPIAFTYELVELLFPWIIFLAIINVTFENENIDIQFFVKLLPNVVQKVTKIVVYLIMLFFSVFITYSSLNLANAVKNHTMPILGISKSWLYWSVSISFIGVTLVILFQMIVYFIRNDVQEGSELE